MRPTDKRPSHAVGALRTLNLAVEVGRSWTVGTKLDALIAQSVLELTPDELTSPVTLDALYGKGEALEQMLAHEVGDVGGGAARIERQNALPCAATA